jgi:hypothetical protein
MDSVNDLTLSDGTGTAMKWYNGSSKMMHVSASTTISGSLTISMANGQVLLPLSNDATSPTLAFGDGDTGFYEAVDDQLYFSAGGSAKWRLKAEAIECISSNGTAHLKTTTGTSTNPSYAFANDTNTGIG